MSGHTLLSLQPPLLSMARFLFTVLCMLSTCVARQRGTAPVVVVVVGGKRHTLVVLQSPLLDTMLA